MVGAEVLLIGAPYQEFIGRSSQLTDLIKPDDFVTKEATSEGSAAIKPVRKDGAIFLSRDLRRVIHMAFEADIGRFDVSELSVAARHISNIGIEGLAWQQSPEQILWLWLSDGSLASVTYQKKNAILGWALHDLSGGLVKSACVIPSSDGKTEDLYLLVDRTIGGSTVRYVEVMQPFYDIVEGQAASDCWYLDCALRYSGAAATTISGLDHLEGQTVTALIDGKVATGMVVTSGAITLPFTGSEVLVGLHTDAYIRSLSPDFGIADGATAGRPRQVPFMAVKARGIGGTVKLAGSSYDGELLAPSGDVTSGVASVAYDTIKRVPINSDYDLEHQLEVRQSQPLPLDVLALVTHMEVSV